MYLVYPRERGERERGESREEKGERRKREERERERERGESTLYGHRGLWLTRPTRLETNIIKIMRWNLLWKMTTSGKLLLLYIHDLYSHDY